MAPRKTAVKKTAARKGRKPVPEDESRRDKFIRIGHRRMLDVLHRIKLLGNLAAPQYDCSAEDVAKMRAAIDQQLNTTFARFEPKMKGGDGKPAFSFKHDGPNTQH